MLKTLLPPVAGILLMTFSLLSCTAPPLRTPEASPHHEAETTPRSPPPVTVAATSPIPPTPTDTPTVPSPSPKSKDTPENPGCRQPIDDYSRVVVNGETLNRRTLWMLEQARLLYGGPGDLLRVTQGSYTDAEAGSFGTHDGGGAVDISIRNPTNPSEMLWDEADAMVAALRVAGFAAWYRAPDDLGAGSPAHIHAIAIGDQELSAAAIDQLIGPWGYFRGMDGLPPPWGPNPDRHGGPIICDWMLALGYRDLRAGGE